MTKQSFGQRLVVARVLYRYAEQHAGLDLNKNVVTALERWIGDKPQRAAHGSSVSGAAARLGHRPATRHV